MYIFNNTNAIILDSYSIQKLLTRHSNLFWLKRKCKKFWAKCLEDKRLHLFLYKFTLLFDVSYPSNENFWWRSKKMILAYFEIWKVGYLWCYIDNEKEVIPSSRYQILQYTHFRFYRFPILIFMTQVVSSRSWKCLHFQHIE